MTIKVHKSDFKDFPGLYSAASYSRRNILEKYNSYIVVDFGKAEHMNPYVLCGYFSENEKISYNELLAMINSLDAGLRFQAYQLLEELRPAEEIYFIYENNLITTV